MKIKTIILIITLLVGCKDPNPNKKNIIDTGGFEIEVPANWKYKKARGIDSFVGRIKSKVVDLSFDWSEMGYANNLAPTINEYVNEEQWEWMPNPPYMKEGVTYTSGDVIVERNRLVGENLSKENQERAVSAFKTIKIRRE